MYGLEMELISKLNEYASLIKSNIAKTSSILKIIE